MSVLKICPFMTKEYYPSDKRVYCIEDECMAWVKIPDSTVKGVFTEYCKLIEK